MTAPPDAVPLLLRPDAAAEYIGVKRPHLDELVRTGQLASTLISPRVRVIPKSECDAYADRIAQQAEAEQAASTTAA